MDRSPARLSASRERHPRVQAWGPRPQPLFVGTPLQQDTKWGLITTTLLPATGDDLEKCRIQKRQIVEVTYWKIGSPCPVPAELTDHLSSLTI